MDYSRDGNVVQIITGGGSDNWSNDQAVWATEEDYRFWNNGGGGGDAASNSSYDQKQSQSRAGSEPPNKKSRNFQDVTTSTNSSNNRSKAIGKMFFKTKLCCKFRAGTCPYITNCNFAHSIEELRRPPPNWQEIVAAHEEDKTTTPSSPPREEFQIPSVVSSGFEGEMMQRSYKGRHCKKFYTEEGCPYGENCTFLHDEQSKNRESVAISLGPGYNGGGGGAAAAGNGTNNSKPSNWKTRICNKWEMTGYCPFGNKCHFAHGSAGLGLTGSNSGNSLSACRGKRLCTSDPSKTSSGGMGASCTELHRYGGGLMDGENRDTASTAVAAPDTKQGGVALKSPADNVVASVTPMAHSDVYHMGVPSQRPSIVMQRPGQRAHQKWKGPDKISRIYGDWIDDIEYG